MDERTNQPSPSMLIGPGIPEPRGLPIETLPEPGEAPSQAEGRRLLIRLVVAFCLCVVLAAVCFVVLPATGVYIPPWIPLVSMGIIAIAALATASAEGRLPQRTPPADAGQDGRPVGCCPGPRPPRFLRTPPR
jgi:hypothetical protein